MPEDSSSQAVTKQDLVTALAEFRKSTKSDLDELRQSTKNDLAELRQSTKNDLAELRQELATAVTEIKQYVDERSEHVETKLLTAFWEWAPTARNAHAADRAGR